MPNTKQTGEEKNFPMIHNNEKSKYRTKKECQKLQGEIPHNI